MRGTRKYARDENQRRAVFQRGGRLRRAARGFGALKNDDEGKDSKKNAGAFLESAINLNLYFQSLFKMHPLLHHGLMLI